MILLSNFVSGLSDHAVEFLIDDGIDLVDNLFVHSLPSSQGVIILR